MAKKEKDMLKERPDYLDKGKRDFEDLKEIVAALRSEDGCPWDRKQTHGSMRICVLEEAAETVDAIGLLEREQNPDGLREELGDLLLQVMLQSRLAEEEGYFKDEGIEIEPVEATQNMDATALLAAGKVDAHLPM